MRNFPPDVNEKKKIKSSSNLNETKKIVNKVNGI